MKPLRYFFFSFALIASLVSCQTSEESLALRQWLEARKIPTDAQVYLFIPTGSCGFCVKKSLEFIEAYPNNPHLQIIAGGDTQRMLKQQLGEKATWTNLHLDVLNTAYREGIGGNGVTIFFMEEGQIKEKLTPTPDVIEEALARIEIGN